MSNFNRSYFDAHTSFLLPEYDHHRMIPQSGVKQYAFPKGDPHNAIWDYLVSGDGKHYFSKCTEGNVPETVKLYEYDVENNDVKLKFDFGQSITYYPRTIRASKIHSSMSELPDGRLIMATHTTAPAPGHPVWMPFAYFNHIWEGFPGSNLIIFDPQSGKVEDLGIPVQRESFYGGVYSARCNAYFATSLIKGHVYRFDLHNRRVTDYGLLTEGSVCRIVEGPDKNIYFGSQNGDLMRINTETLQFEDINIRLPLNTVSADFNIHLMMYAKNGSDGRLYISARYSDTLYAYDPQGNILSEIGSIMPESLSKYPWDGVIHGMDFDADGVLWYGLMMHPKKGQCRNAGELAFYLCSWDFINKGKPVNYGLVGTPERRTLVFCDLHIRNNILIGCDTNHWFDPCAMLQVDLDKLKADYKAGIKGPLCRDPGHYTFFDKAYDIYPGDLIKDAEALQAQIEQDKELRQKYTFKRGFFFNEYKKGYVVKPWRKIGCADSRVRSVKVNSDGSIAAVCGDKQFYYLHIDNGEILAVEQCSTECIELQPDFTEKFKHSELPINCGRAWIATAAFAVEWNNGRQIVGTKDGMLCIISGENVFSLGNIGIAGPVHQMCADKSKTVLYGVAGDYDDIGMLFTYDDIHGIRQLGRISFTDDRPLKGEKCLMNQPVAIDVSDDGSRLVIGSADYKASIAIFEL